MMSRSSVQPPRSVTQLFVESLRLSPKQREVLDTLQKFDNGARVTDIASQLNMHVNTVRGHLDELMKLEAVQAVPARKQGRGRPSLVFHVRIPNNSSIAQEYTSLVSTLVELIGDPDNPSNDELKQAQQLGRKWARNMNVGTGWEQSYDSLSPALVTLRDMGFDPALETDDNDSPSRITLNSCPFVSKKVPHPSKLICALHQGLVQELSSASDKTHLVLVPYSGPGTCSIAVESTST